MARYFFPNTFEDFDPDKSKDLIVGGKINPNCKVAIGLNAKWQYNIKLLEPQNLDHHDYSVYTGTSGIALLKLLKDQDNKTSLLDIKNNYLGLNRLKLKRHSFICGDAGPLAIGIVICYKLGQKDEMNELLRVFNGMRDKVNDIGSDLPNEYLYGRAGYLYAVLYVNKRVSPPPFDDMAIRQIIEAILLSGKNMSKALQLSSKCPLMYEWHNSKYLGAAHGISGIMYILLQAREYLTEDELSRLVRPTVDYMITLRFESGNFPSSLGSDKPDKYVQWCHGAPGFLFMFSMAYKVFGDPKYLQLAVDCGEVVWERGLLRKGYSLCHGVSGNAYCFLELYQTTKEEKYLYRALKFAEYCLDYSESREEYPPDRPLSLFEGVAGRLYLLLDIQKPFEAKFPGFTL